MLRFSTQNMNKTIFKYASTLPKTNSVILIANKLQFESSVFPVLTSSLVGPLVNDDLKAVHLLSNDTVYIAAKISSTVTRNGGLIREDLIREMVKANTPKNGTLAISVCLSTADEAVTAMQGITRSFPAFSVKSSVVERVVNVNFVVTDGSIVDYEKIQVPLFNY